MSPLFTDSASLRRYVLAVAKETSNPYHVAEKVLAEVSTTEELRVIAETTLNGWVWSILKRPHVTPNNDDKPASGREDSGAAFFSDSPQARTFIDANGVRRASRRQVDFVDALGAELNRRVKVGVGIDDRKHLGECTIQDLQWMATYRRKVAAKNEATARQFDELAEALVVSKVETVAELDRKTAEAILLK